jgi:hypothetical protein
LAGLLQCRPQSVGGWFASRHLHDADRVRNDPLCPLLLLLSTTFSLPLVTLTVASVWNGTPLNLGLTCW